MNKREIKELVKQVDTIFFEQWDPLGINDIPLSPKDEYTSYAGRFVRMVLENASETEITTALLKIETEQMGLSPVSEAHAQQVAREILKLKSRKLN
ncbi:hypothetical protein [Lacunimicrobium album]